MSQPASDDSKDPFSPGEQYTLPGEQSSGDVVGGRSGGTGSGSNRDSPETDADAREARRVAFRASLHGREVQIDSQVFYDTTPEGELFPVHGGMEGYEASMEDEAGRDDDSEEVSEEDGAHDEDGSNEASEDDGPDHEGDYIHDGDYIHGGKDFPSPLEYNPWSADPPSRSDNGADNPNFIARLTSALQDVTDRATSSSDVEIADSQAGSDDLDNSINDAAPSIKVEVGDSQVDSDELENTNKDATQSSDEEMAESQAGSDGLDDTANHVIPWTEVEVAGPRAEPVDPVNSVSEAALSSDQETADSQASSDDLYDNAADYSDPSSDFELADSQEDSDEAAPLSEEEVADSQDDSDDLVVRSDTSDSDADTIVLRQPNRVRLAPMGAFVRVPINHRNNHNPASDPDSSSSDQGSDSSLSELEQTPEPVDPELRRLDFESKRRTLKLCLCLGWCTCTRYSNFYGSRNVNDAAAPLVLPSQTHLSESALSNERFPTSAIRSTIAAEERYEERIIGQQRFSWDLKRRPVLAPVSWEGEEWSEFPGNYKPASVEEVSDAGD